jgi:hypothetical protein
MATSSDATTNVDSNEEDASKPLWKYVTKHGKINGGGGNMLWQCNFCNRTHKSSYTRVRAHLLKLPGQGIGVCKKVTIKDISEMQKLEDEAKERARENAPKKVPLPRSSDNTESSFFLEGFHSKKRKSNVGGRINPIDKAFDNAKRSELDGHIARMFFSGGLPFHLARNPYYLSSYTFAANNHLPGYLPPSYNKLRTTLLIEERANIERLLQPIKTTWKEKGVSIISDGWSDSQRRPLINFMGATEGGAMFLKAIDCSGEIKDKYYIFNLMKEVIEEVGPNNVVQVVTDNAKNCAGARTLIEQIYPHIFWTPCVVHTLNLALQNICAAKNIENNQIAYHECRWITWIADDCLFIKNFIMNHSMRLAMFNECVSLKLLSVATTRFASTLVMLKRFKLIKGGLQTLVISEKWSTYREDDVAKAKTIKDLILDDIWWDKIDYALSFTAPIYDMLRICDTDRGCLHLVYDMWDSMIEKVKSAIYKNEKKKMEESSTFFDAVYNILIDRWTKNNTPLHCMAHSLNPK